MAPKSKIRLVDQPPSAFSSDEDEEEQSEEEELSEQEVDKSEAEYESESEEEEPSTPILNQDHSLSECDESQETLPSPSASDFTIKPILSSKLAPASPPKAPAPSKSSAKRASEAIEKDSKKKRSKTGEGDGNAEEKKSAASAGSNRLWNDEDQLAILQGMVDYKAQKGAYTDMSAFHNFIKDKLHVEVSKIQMTEKIKRLRKKFLTLSEKGDELDFPKPRDSKLFELSKQIWGIALGSVNGKNLNAISNHVELNVKIANEKVKKPAEVKKISEKPGEVKKISEKSVEVKKISESRNSVKVDNYMNIPNEEESEKKRKKTATKAEEIEKKKKKKQRIALVGKDKQIAFEEKEERVEQSALEEKDYQTVVEETDKQIALDERDKQIAIDERDKQIDLEDNNKEVAIKDIVNGEVETEEGDFNSKYPHLANSFSKKSYSLSSPETLNMLKKKLNLIGSSKAEEMEEKWTKLWEEHAELCGKMTDLLTQQMGLVLEAIRQQRGRPSMGLDNDLEELIGTTRKTTSESKTSRSLKVVLKKKYLSTSGDQHTTDRPSARFRSSGSSVAPSRSKSSEKRPIKEAEVEVLGETLTADPKRARVDEESPLVHALTRGTASLLEMFNLLFQLSPPPPSLLNETTNYVGAKFAHHLSQVASIGAELFVRAQLPITEREEEMKQLKETLKEQDARLKEQDAQLRSLRRYPGSDQFLQDAITHFVSRPTDLPRLVSALCSSKDAAHSLFQTLRRDPVGLKMLRRATAWGYHRGKKAMQDVLYQTLEEVLPEDWEEVHAVLPPEISSPGPEPFSNLPANPTSPSTVASRNQDF